MQSHGIVVVVAVIIIYYINSTKEVYSYEEINTLEETKTTVKKEEIEEDKIVVHITGAVKKQGVVEVKENARINDVIAEAGGTTEDADLKNVNLAYVVEDGQKIYIPSVKDKLEIEEDGEIVTESAGENVLREEDENGKSSRININTANAEALTAIPGVGESTAEKIITYRKENGKFKTVEDIKNVSGIGDKKYEAIKDYISV